MTKDKGQILQVLVVGGGAAGFFAAIAVARTYPEARVTILEAGSEPLAKVRISGGGRCNVTHACFTPAALVPNYPRGGKELRGAFSRFQPKDVVAWFTAASVELKTEADGRMFPVTDDSGTIVDCLLEAATAAGVKLRTKAPVVAVEFGEESRFEVESKSGESWQADRLLLATGSNPLGYRIAEKFGHQIEPPVPSLFTFNVRDSRLEDLAGISVPSVRVSLPEANLQQTGPLLITHWGVSGPAILKLSAWGARFLYEQRYRTTLMINWLPEYKPEPLRSALLAAKEDFAKKAIGTVNPFSLPRRLWERLLLATAITPEQRWAEISKKSLQQLQTELTQSQYQITGKGIFKEEFVTCGGVNLKQVNFKTMESRLCPGLYFAGEILDIDGITGGFNFQSAWTTGWLAGQAMGAQGVTG
ncbi:NAD(P)/FAD-dependent oxidoreductase [[Phormidium] sp. ETS-05]|uniref:NAD(P)/FAD-dependent oxidoreductase n=1 Tax=[Phormidium] sp. ETS-05 TaxID=222819 RepID=UPI001E40730B|nr:NAD(P)/FAD-dependent oxidoreductase [[Phormidium] sp. ETS-05]